MLCMCIYIRCCDDSIEDRIVLKEVEEVDRCDLCILGNVCFGVVLRCRMAGSDKGIWR